MQDSRYWLRFLPGILIILFVGRQLLQVDFTSEQEPFVAPTVVSTKEQFSQIHELGVDPDKKEVGKKVEKPKPQKVVKPPAKPKPSLSNFQLKGITISGDEKKAYFYSRQTKDLKPYRVNDSLGSDQIQEITADQVRLAKNGWVKLYVYRSSSNVSASSQKNITKTPKIENKDTKPKITEEEGVRVYDFPATDSDSLYK